WKNNTKIDFGIEFVSNNITPPESVYWARNSAINLLAGLGINFTTNVSASRIDNWLHTYDICGAIGEAKQAAIQNSIYYAQAYHIEKEAFSTSTSMLLAELTENTILKYPKKVNKACENLIQILNNINVTNFGARLEYRIGLPIINTFYSQVEVKNRPFLNTNPFYLIPTQLVSDVKIAKIKTFLNLYNFSLIFLLIILYNLPPIILYLIQNHLDIVYLF